MTGAPDLPQTVRVGAGPRPLAGKPRIPGAKYATVRAMLAAALGNGPAVISGIPWTDDTAVILGAFHALGIATEQVEDETLRITGCGGHWPVTGPVAIDAGNAGAVLRLLLGVLATLPEVTFTTAYPDSLGKRPNGDLLDALRQLGVGIAAAGPDGTLPITLQRGALHGGAVTISGARGSQYLSALLFLAPLIGEDVRITVTGGLRSAGFIRLTLSMLRQAGIMIEAAPDLLAFTIPAGQHYQARDWRLARDWPTAGMWLAAGAMIGGQIILDDLDLTAEDGAALLTALRAFGVTPTIAPMPHNPELARVAIVDTAPPQAATLDGEPVLDSVLVLAALATVAAGTTTFTNVAALRLKESDRINALCAELNRAGATALPGDDTVSIIGHPEGLAGGATVDAHHDHRLAMALALVALRCQAPLTITGAEHVAKSYPAFWSEWARLGAVMEVLP